MAYPSSPQLKQARVLGGSGQSALAWLKSITSISASSYCLNDLPHLPGLTTVVASHRIILLGTVTGEMTLFTTPVHFLVAGCDHQLSHSEDLLAASKVVVAGALASERTIGVIIFEGVLGGARLDVLVTFRGCQHSGCIQNAVQGK